jgi:hypothetical protein
MREHESADVVLSLEPTVTSPDGPAVAPATPPDRGRRSLGNGTAVVLAALGAVALGGVGVGAFVAAGNKVDDGIRACRQVVSTAPDACDSMKNVVHGWDWVAAAAWAGAAASAGIAIFAWTTGGASLRPSSPSARLLVGPGSLGIAGTF